MFGWMRSRRRHRETDFVADPNEAERDSGEEELEAEGEEDREAAPDGMTRVKTDFI